MAFHNSVCTALMDDKFWYTNFPLDQTWTTITAGAPRSILIIGAPYHIALICKFEDLEPQNVQAIWVAMNSSYLKERLTEMAVDEGVSAYLQLMNSNVDIKFWFHRLTSLEDPEDETLGLHGDEYQGLKEVLCEEVGTLVP